MTDQTTADSAETIDALSDTLYDALYAITPFAEQHFADEREGLRNAVCAVLKQAAVLPATTNHDTDTGASKRGAKAEALLLRFTAEAHRRKWDYDRGLDDDGVPIKSEAFDALHRLGEEMRVELEKLRRVADETAATDTQALCGKDRGVSGLYYRPCARPAGHAEAYCKSADGSHLFLAGQPDTETQAHVCKPDAIAYYCPTSGETESNCHGGFDACCDRPDLHQPAAGARQDGAQQ
ncbi:hypothetical protein ACN6LI_003338 [Streptomyces violaceoruber]